MKPTLIPILIPCLAVLLSSAALAVWLTAIETPELSLRVPGTDRSADATSEPARPLASTFTPGPGKPAALSGAWPRFRGELFDGIAHESIPLARAWPTAGPAVLWSLDVGEGYAGAAVRDGRVYLLDYDPAEEADALRCLSLADGAEIWRVSYPVTIKRNHGMSRTVPAVNEQYVVTIGPKCHIMCADAKTGEVLWLKDMVREFGATIPQWYAGQCPMIDGELAIFAPGGDCLLVALDLRSGEVVWKSPNPRGWAMTHASIMPMEIAGRKMYVYLGKGGVAGIAADNGELLWDTTVWKIGIATCPSPVVLPEGRLFCSGGYNSGAVMLQVTHDGGAFKADELFRLEPKRFGSTQHTPIYYKNHLFGVREHDKQLVCLDLDGNEVWASGRENKFGLGPYLVADDRIYVLDDSGLLTMADATPEAYKPLGQARILDGHDAWAPMALAAGRLVLRDMTRMACVDVAESLPRPGASADVTRRVGQGRVDAWWGNANQMAVIRTSWPRITQNERPQPHQDSGLHRPALQLHARPARNP